jgi:hypothetical protein
VYITDIRSAVGALGCTGSPAGIAVSIFYASQQDDLAITRRHHAETLTNFLPSRADVLAWEGYDFQFVPYFIETDPALAAAVGATHSKSGDD